MHEVACVHDSVRVNINNIRGKSLDDAMLTMSLDDRMTGHQDHVGFLLSLAKKSPRRRNSRHPTKPTINTQTMYL